MYDNDQRMKLKKIIEEECDIAEKEAARIEESISNYIKKEYPDIDNVCEQLDNDIEKIMRFIFGKKFLKEDIDCFLDKLKETNQEKAKYENDRTSMSEKQYLKYISEGNEQEADDYKNQFIPDKLYKYYGLSARDNIKSLRLNKMKIECLIHNKVYAPMLNQLNDPFEGYFFFLDIDYLKFLGVKNTSAFEHFRNKLISTLRICSLSGAKEQSMPMWAYYSNNHQGYCVEYDIPQDIKKFTFPVIYTSERECANEVYINGLLAVQNNDGEKDLSYASMKNILSYAHKHTSWSHEQEYRIIVPESCKYIQLKPKKIYIGMNCKSYYKKKIISYGKKHIGEVEVYTMELGTNSDEFVLVPKRIC